MLIVTQPKLRASKQRWFTACSMNTLKRFAGIQLLVFVIIFAITFTPANFVFPLLIGVLVPCRHVLMPKYFSEFDLGMLDPLDGTPMSPAHEAQPEPTAEFGDEEIIDFERESLGRKTDDGTPIPSGVEVELPSVDVHV